MKVAKVSLLYSGLIFADSDILTKEPKFAKGPWCVAFGFFWNFREIKNRCRVAAAVCVMIGS